MKAKTKTLSEWIKHMVKDLVSNDGFDPLGYKFKINKSLFLHICRVAKHNYKDWNNEINQ